MCVPSVCPESVKVPVSSLVQMVLGKPPSFATTASRWPSPLRSPRATERLALFPSAYPELVNMEVAWALAMPAQAPPARRTGSRKTVGVRWLGMGVLSLGRDVIDRRPS